MKKQLFLAIAFAAVLTTDVEFGIQPATAAQNEVEPLTLKDEIVETVTPQKYIMRKRVRRR